MDKMKKGFTLIELLTVIAIVSILLGIALPRFKGMKDEGTIAKAKGELRTLQTAVESYYIHNRAYPTLLSAIQTASPNIVPAVPADPFAAAATTGYSYVRGGTNNQYYIIYSVGPAGNGSAAISLTNTVTETNPTSCIFVSNMSQDSTP